MERATATREGKYVVLVTASSTTIENGHVVVVDADGYAVEASATTGLIAVGIAEQTVETLASQHNTIRVRRGIALLDNSDGADEITIADTMQECYLVGAASVAKGNGATTEGGAATRSKAGKVLEIEEKGVWVEIGGKN